MWLQEKKEKKNTSTVLNDQKYPRHHRQTFVSESSLPLSSCHLFSPYKHSVCFVMFWFVLLCISTSKALLIILPANHPGWLWEVSIMFNGFNLVHYQSLRWALSVNHPNSIKMFYFCFLCSSLSIFPLQLLPKETQNVLYSKAFQSLQRNNPSLSYWFLIMFSLFWLTLTKALSMTMTVVLIFWIYEFMNPWDP